MSREIRRFRDLDDMSRAAAMLITDTALGRVAAAGRFTLVLSGGSTPRRLYQFLTSPPFVLRIPWAKTHIFWTDERFVPPADPGSNFGAARRLLLDRVPIPPSNIHSIQVEGIPPREAAENYEADIRSFFGLGPAGDGGGTPPSFDLVLLGVGEDGHTASLFPGSPAFSSQRWITAVKAPDGVPYPLRLTMTIPLINRARLVLFLSAGTEKKAAVRRALTGREAVELRSPAAPVAAMERTAWYIAGNAA
jgi:6-phosphogluconolactonase